MKISIIKRFLIFIFIFPVFLAHSEGEKVIFIVNEKNPITRLSKEEIASFYLKTKREWSDGTPIRFMDFDDGSERKIFLETILNKTSSDINNFWIKQKQDSGNTAPGQVPNDQKMMELVARFPGAIGYVTSDKYKAKKGIKEIEISESP